jgi:hypothetical protein
MNREIIHTLGDRPAFITHGNCRIAVAIHDGWYLSERARLRRRSAKAHPDAIGKSNSAAFRHAWKAYHEWELEQTAWYAPYGLVPPTPSATDLKASPSVGKQSSKAQLIRDYIQARPDAGADEISTSLHVERQYVVTICSRARLHGARLTMVERVRRVIADGKLHAPRDFGDIPNETLTRVLSRLKQTGMPIATTSLQRKTYYQLYIGGIEKALQ